MTAEAPDPLVGTTLDGRYRIDGVLGEGGMGRVYRAEHLAIRKPVALKLLGAGDPDSRARKRFAREAFATGKAAHPNCVLVSDSGVLPDGRMFLVMELLEGRTLGQMIEADGKLSPARALHIGKHILRGLGHAHDIGIVHRDIKPGNVMVVEHLGDPDFAKVLDFGLAKLRKDVQEEEGGGDLTETGIAFGTPSYMAPEQVLGRGVDGRSDLYTVGVLLYEMLAGRPPFVDPEPHRRAVAHVKQEPPPLAEVAPDVVLPDGLQELVSRALSKQPGDRFTSAQEMIEAIERVQAAMARAAPAGAEPPTIVDVEPPTIVDVEPPAMPVAAPRAVAAVAAPPVAGPRRMAADRRRVLIAAAAVAAIAVLAAVVGIVTSSGAGSSSAAAKPAPGEPAGDIELDTGDIARAEAMIAKGERARAARLLRRLRKERPRDAAVPYTLGKLHLSWQAPLDAMRAYRQALELDPSYAQNQSLIDDAIRTLSSASGHREAARLLTEIGAPAVQKLERVASSHPVSLVRRRAAAILRAIRAR